MTEDGRLKNINFNIFVKYLLEKYKIVIDDSKNYYFYSKQYNFWLKADISDICRIARKIMHKFKNDTWQAKFKYEVKEILELSAKRISEAEDDENHINQKLTLGDSELKTVLQEIMGYVLTHRMDAQKFFVFWSAGSSGKSTLCDVLVWLAGEENVSTVSLGSLNDKFARSQIEGKILNLATENETKKVKTALLKQIVGGDVIQIECKGKAPRSYRPHVKCVFAVNNLPQFCENSYVMLRRMLIVPFPALFTDNPNTDNPNEFQRIPNFQENLKPELAGIFNFAMEGYKRLRDNNFVFTKSKRIDDIMRNYTQQYSPVQEFTQECLIKANDKKMYKKDLYEKFREWCKDNDLDNPFDNIRGFLAETKKQFPHFGLAYDEFNSSGKPYKSNGKAYIRGVAFTEEYDNGEGLLNNDD